MYTRDFYELDKMLAQLRNVIDLQLIEFRSINDQLSKAFNHCLPEIDRLKQISNDLLPYINIKELTLPLREVLAKLPPKEFLNFPAYSAIQSYIGTVNYRNYDSFINAIAFEIDTTFLNYSEKQKAVLIKKVLKYFIQKIQSLSPSYINYQGIIQNLLSIVAILLTLFQIYQSEISTNEIKNSVRDQLADIRQEVLEKVEEINAEEDISKIYIAKSKVIVRVEPKKSAHQICLLYPNQEVKFVNKKNNWYYIEFFDYINAVPRMGYVYKKYLMPKKKIVERTTQKEVVDHKRTLEEASLDVRRYLKRNLSDREIDQLVRKVRKELWGE